MTPLLHFNIGNNEGFVIVGGETKGKEILGYADAGTIDMNNIPVNMQLNLLKNNSLEETFWNRYCECVARRLRLFSTEKGRDGKLSYCRELLN